MTVDEILWKEGKYRLIFVWLVWRVEFTITHITGIFSRPVQIIDTSAFPGGV